MKKGTLFFLSALLVFLAGSGRAAVPEKGKLPVISIAYTTNTWGQIEPIHS